MKVIYKKLWLLCVEREIGQAELRKRTGFSSATFTKLRKNSRGELVCASQNCRSNEL